MGRAADACVAGEQCLVRKCKEGSCESAVQDCLGKQICLALESILRALLHENNIKRILRLLYSEL